MKLTYRGVRYDYVPSPALKAGSLFAQGMYRGAAIGFRPIDNVPDAPGIDLQWRGVAYHSGKTEAAEVTAALPASPSAPTTAPVEVPTPMTMADRSRSLFLSHHRRIRRREQGMLVRLAQKIGVPLDDVAHYESQIQGKIPHDFSGYDDSHCAMS